MSKKDLVIIYAIATGIFILMYCFCPGIDYPDTVTYLLAKDQLLQNLKFDASRPPLYPLFLIITYNNTLAIIAQNIIFFVSIGFFYSLLKKILQSRRLIFLCMLIYIAHPAFIFYNYQMLPESLSISLCAIYLYYLVKYIIHEKTIDCWIFHILTVTLILIRPFFTFLIGISIGLFIYQMLFKRNIRRLGMYFLPVIFSFSLIGMYGMVLKRNYGVWGISCTADINRYWIMREHHFIDLELIKNEEIKSLFQEHSPEQYYPEAMYIYQTYGWKGLHSIVQASMKENYKSFWVGEDITKFRINNFKEVVGGGSIGDFWKVVSFFCSVTFFQLCTILFIYFLWLTYSIFKTRKIPIVSVTFGVYIVVNLLMLFFMSYNDCSRLATPMLSVSLLVIAQLANGVFYMVENRKIPINSL